MAANFRWLFLNKTAFQFNWLRTQNELKLFAKEVLINLHIVHAGVGVRHNLNRNMKQSKPLLYDRRIINRVNLFLEQNSNQTTVNVYQIARELMKLYPEYRRRKFGPFCKLVLQAYCIISESYGVNQLGLQSVKVEKEEKDYDTEQVEERPPKNLMSTIMSTMYNKNNTRFQKQPMSEPISILSSDESGVEGPTSNGKTADWDSNKPSVAGVENTAKRSLPLNFTTGNSMKRAKTSFVAQNHNRNEKHNDRSTGRKLFHNLEDDSGDGGSQLGDKLRKSQKHKKTVNLRKAERTFEEIGGMEKTLKDLCELLINIQTPDIYLHLGLMPPSGILIHGPTGCGKTLLAEAIAGQLHLDLIEVPATELIAGISGESEERIRDIFAQAAESSPCVLFIDEIDVISSNRAFAQKDMDRRIVSQLITCIDELKLCDRGNSVLVIGATTRPDIIDPALRRFGRFDHEVQISIPTRKGRKDILMIISRALTIAKDIDFDKLAELTPGYVGADLQALLVRAASIAVKRKCTQHYRNLEAKIHGTIDVVNLDDEEIDMLETDETVGTSLKIRSDKDNIDQAIYKNAENDVKKKIMEKESMEEEIMEGKDLNKTSGERMEIGKKVAGSDKTVGNDIHEPTLLQLINWLENPPDDFNDPEFCITFEDFMAALKVVQPSAKREGFITVPDVTWDDIGSLQDIRDELKLAVLAPVKYPEKLIRLGLNSPSGVLLCGPPGCGKTLLAKAIANEAGINFISVKGPELINMYVGESERAVRACFQRARNSAPCVIFFDEFDSLCPKRSEGNNSTSGTRIVNQLLTEMDGIEERKGVYVLAATNRPDIIDPAILRPGRLDTILYVGLPKENDRVSILKAISKNGTCPVFSDDVILEELASKTDGYTGADLAGLVKQAAMIALRDSLKNVDQKLENLCVRKQNFEEAIKLLRPSISEQDRKLYEKLRVKYAAPRNLDMER